MSYPGWSRAAVLQYIALLKDAHLERVWRYADALVRRERRHRKRKKA
jgi:hypothetical protein